MTANGAAEARLVSAIQQLSATNVELATVLADSLAVIAEEALQNPQFGARLRDVLADRRGTPPAAPDAAEDVAVKAKPKRGRRTPGPWDPFVVYAEVGEEGLRERLRQLDLEQLRDIIAEQGFNNDGLAMKWKTVNRVIGRIVDRVVEKSTKGDAFRRS